MKCDYIVEVNGRWLPTYGTLHVEHGRLPPSPLPFPPSPPSLSLSLKILLGFPNSLRVTLHTPE